MIAGVESVMIIEAQATPRNKVIEKLRNVTEKSISHVVRVSGASAFGAQQVVMSGAFRSTVVERGWEDWDIESQRFPRLSEGHEFIPGVTWPTATFSDLMIVFLGNRRVDTKQIGRVHTAGYAVIHVPDQNVMFTGYIVEGHSACYC